MAEDVKYKISLQDKFSNKIKGASNSVDTFDKKIIGAAKSIGVMAAATVGLAKAFGLARKSFTLGADMEQTEIAFGTFLRSAEKGKDVIADLNKFANATPFNNEEIIKTGRVLLAANVPAEKLTTTLSTIGDIAAGTKVPITELGAIYSKVMNKGKLQAEELNQLAERGIPIIDVLSKEFGVTKQEVFELGSKGKITSDVMNKAFSTMTKEGGIFFKLMSKQSKSASGLLSTFAGKMQMVGINLGKRMLPAVKKTTKGLIEFTDKLIQITKIPAAEALKDQQQEATVLVSKLRNLNLEESDRVEIINKLNDISPELVKGLDAENLSMEKLTSNLREFNKAQAKRIVLSGLEEKELKLINKEAERRASIEEMLYDKKGAFVGLGRRREGIAETDESVFKRLGITREGAFTAYDEFIKAIEDGNADLAESVVERNKIIFDPVSGSRDLARSTIKQLRKINDEAGEQVDIAGRISRMQKELGLDDKAQSNLNPLATAVPGSELKDSIQTIKSAAPKTFNINIGKFVENFTVQSDTITESAPEVREFFEDELLKMLADAQAVS